MLDRLKGARAGDGELAQRKPEEGRMASDLPRFTPQPGGFGRRATPVGGAPAPVAPAAERETGPAAGPQAPSGGPEPRPAARGANAGWTRGAERGEPASNDISGRIADWLMRELKDQRGVHCETILTAVGALAGYAAQQALWEGMVKPGKLAISEAFSVVETPSGATYFFGEALDSLLASVEPRHLSIWKIVAGGALARGGDHLPEIGNLLRHTAASVGTSAFGLPRLPDEHLPSIMPRAALERFWPGARLLLALAEPLTWPQHMANAAQKLMQAMAGSIAPDLAVRIVMEAAVPMSRVDPATVPNN